MVCGRNWSSIKLLRELSGKPPYDEVKDKLNQSGMALSVVSNSAYVSRRDCSRTRGYFDDEPASALDSSCNA